MNLMVCFLGSLAVHKVWSTMEPCSNHSINLPVVELTQQHLIDKILEDLYMDDKTRAKETPAVSAQILQKHATSEDHNNSCDYCLVIGKLNYLEKSSRSDSAYATHQCARFASNPKVEHAAAL
jgi:hypothetical protein